MQKENKVIVTSVNNNKFYREFNICKAEDLKNIKQAIDIQFAKDYVVWDKNFPLFQTPSDLDEKLKDVSSFNKLKNKIIKLVKNINKDFKMLKCWCNLTTENSKYLFHTHNTKLTCVYYLQSNQDCYGTRLENEKIIFPSTQNSILMFNGSVSHSIEYMPNKVFDSVDSHRYSVVFDFI